MFSKIKKETLIKISIVFLIIMSIPLIPIFIQFIFQIGKYCGIFLRNLYFFVDF